MQVKVLTTQNVAIHYPIASLGDRIVAYLLDSLIKIIYALAVLALLITIDLRVVWIWLVLIGVPFLFYHLMFEIFMDGQSPGKLVMKIKVLRLDGTPASIGDYLLRWIFGFVDIQIMSGLIAVIVISTSDKGQRLGDIAAGTTVVRLSEVAQATTQNLPAAPDPDYLASFPQVVQLNESDIELVQQALEVNRDSGNNIPVMAATERIKSLLGIQTDLPPVKFLYTIIKDFQHLTSR